LDNHEVVSLPSASALALLRRELAGRPPAPRQAAIVADPLFDPADPAFARLTASRQEAEAIAALAPPDQTRLAVGADASLDEVRGDRLAGFRTVHFATHGVIDAEHPELSGLALSTVDARGRRREGFLRLRDIYGLRLDAGLVVLSGCRTALGREVRGEGLTGLTQGFFHAGAARLVASLWKVEDRATAELMTRFYRAMWVEGLAPAAALRAAQLSLRRERRWRDPYFWAGFVLQGDWR
jgi:CHAT domain-containing protein